MVNDKNRADGAAGLGLEVAFSRGHLLELLRVCMSAERVGTLTALVTSNHSERLG